MTFESLLTIKTDDKLRLAIASSVCDGLFSHRHSPVAFETDETKDRFRAALALALHGHSNALDSVVQLRSQGWPHDSNMHETVEIGHRKIQDELKRIFAKRCQAVGYTGPLSAPSVIVIEGQEYAAVQVDELVPEASILAVKIVNEDFHRFRRGELILKKKSWMQIDSVERPFDDDRIIAEMRQDFKLHWRSNATLGYVAGPFRIGF